MFMPGSNKFTKSRQPKISYLANFPASGAVAGVHTYASIGIGAADEDRILLAHMGGSNNAGGSASASLPRFDGVAADGFVIPNIMRSASILAWKFLPAGVATVFDFTAANSNIAGALCAITGVQSHAPILSGAAGANSGGAAQSFPSINIGKGDLAVFCYFDAAVGLTTYSTATKITDVGQLSVAYICPDAPITGHVESVTAAASWWTQAYTVWR